jgi:hypothetical protein
MKTLAKIAVLAGLVTLASGREASAAACGIGSKIWEGNNGTGARVLAFTTNFWTLKGISTTFEIMGCTEKDNWLKKGADKVTQAKIEHFASENLDHLALEMAAGRGEHLDALGRLFEVREEDADALRSLAQTHFEVLFPNDQATSTEMLQTLASLMSENRVLSEYVEK